MRQLYRDHSVCTQAFNMSILSHHTHISWPDENATLSKSADVPLRSTYFACRVFGCPLNVKMCFEQPSYQLWKCGNVKTWKLVCHEELSYQRRKCGNVEVSTFPHFHTSTVGNLVIQDTFPHFHISTPLYSVTYLFKTYFYINLLFSALIMNNFAFGSFHSDDAFCALLPNCKSQNFPRMKFRCST